MNQRVGLCILVAFLSACQPGGGAVSIDTTGGDLAGSGDVPVDGARPDDGMGDVPDGDVAAMDAAGEDLPAPDGTLPPDLAPDTCQPDCAGRECGDDGCGGSCGTCPTAAPICQDGLCAVECEPDCDGAECGDDGCGGSCGTCPAAAPFCVDHLCAVTCDPDCEGKDCGPDGCGFSCGECDEGFECVEGLCEEICVPECTGKECGPDGCGGACGDCAEGLFCVDGLCAEDCTSDEGCTEADLTSCTGDLTGVLTCLEVAEGCFQWSEPVACPENEHCEEGECVADCIPSCVGKACGEDGCGGSCGTCTGAQESCVQGTCVCQGACTGKACGPDGCGGSCGDCLDCDGHAADYLCTAAGTCIDPCCPSCAGKACGADDGCAGACIGTCPTGQSCINYACVPNCVPSCTGKECGGNGCGGSCGTCPAGLQCLASGQCQTVCDLACTGKACGSDGCGGFCGFCPAGKVCTDGGQCVTTCTPSCTGKACGSNGCGGTCGSCSTGLFCSAAGQCVASCTPSCAFKECGPNGCGGSCGACAGSLLCTAAGQCGSVCTQCIDDPSCADLDFSSGSLGSWAIDAAQVVPSFGSTQPLSGGHMLKLTTGEGLTEADSEAVFQTCLPPGAYVAASDWRIYSAEFTEWCGSQFQDSFHAWLTVGGQFVELAHTSIDDLCPPDECTGCGGQYVGLEPAELSLDQDGVYKTPWFQVAAPVTVSAPGQILELHLEATDAGDTIFDSVLLVDRVRFIPCADWCQEVGQACGPSPCGDSCGSCTGPQQQCVGGQCVCVPQCLSKQCGDDGCGGTCGTCTGIQQQCVAGKCVCIPACQGKQCGTDGCGGSCGSCNDFLPCTIDTCVSGQCTHVDQGCCATDADCNDGNVCTIDDCVDTFCQWSPSGDPACCEPVEYEETFGDGVGQGWTASANIGNVGWWVWLNPPTGGSAALYYGNPSVGNYQSTAVNQGTITTPTVALDPGRAWSVAFDAYLDVETSASYDKLTFWVSWDGGPWVLLWDKSDYGTMKTWKAVSLDISPLAGASVQFMFRFESVNTYYNSTLGVLVDDFRLETTCAAPACLTEGDCASDVPGAADSCVAKICQWVLPVTCASTAACADGSECTTDLCVNGICSWQEIEDCCEFDADCADGDPCTQDTCVDFIFLTYCDNAPIAGCCNTSQDCNDNNVCTTDSCPQPGAQCAHGQVQGCCNTAAECGDGDPCTQDVCAGHQCTHTNICCQTAAQCNDGNPCTQDACVQGFCSNTWVGGEGCCAAVYFRDDFGTNLGWQYGSNWQRGLATASGGNNNPDPANDHTTTADDYVAGVVIGGNVPTTVGGFYYLTSPAINLSAAVSPRLSLWRWLNSDYSPYMENRIQVGNGTTWTTIWQTGGSPGVADTSWTHMDLDVTAFKSSTFRLRIGYSVGSTGAYIASGWNVDDVIVYEGSKIGVKPMCCTTTSDCQGIYSPGTCTSGACF